MIPQYDITTCANLFSFAMDCRVFRIKIFCVSKTYLQKRQSAGNGYGLYLIQEMIRNYALNIDKQTIAGNQLGQIPKGDPGERPEETFWAVNALRNVVGSYKKFGVGERMTQEKADELRRRYGPPGVLEV